MTAKFREYRLSSEGISPGQHREQEVLRINDIADELERLTIQYEALTDDDTDGVERRRRKIRMQRNALNTELGLFMARLGEVDRLRKLQRLPFSARVRELRSYVQTTLETARSIALPPASR